MGQTARQWAYTTLTQDVGLGELVSGDRILQGQSMMTAQIERPFIVLKFSADVDLDAFDDPDIVQRPNHQIFEVWCHDSRPSYVQIDSICDLVKKALRTEQSSVAAYIMAVKFIGISADLQDMTMDTVLRYLTFQLVMSQ